MTATLIKMDEAQYRSLTDKISISELKVFIECPYKYKYQYLDGNRTKSTLSMQKGTAFHMALLEPETFRDKVEAFSDLRSSAARAAKQFGKTPIREEDFEDIVRAAEAVRSDSRFLELLKDIQVETSLFWDDPHVNVPCKARLDAFCNITKSIVDVKTCVSIEEFRRQVHYFGYDLQGAYYKDALENHAKEKFDFYFLAVELTAPYRYKYFKLSDALYQEARDRYKIALTDYKVARDNDHFPHPSEIIEELLPIGSSKKHKSIEIKELK